MKDFLIPINKLMIVISITACILAIAAVYLLEEEKPVEELRCGVIDEPVCGNMFLESGMPTNEKGRQLFENNCKACHAIDDVVVGPALRGIQKRRPKKWLYKFINNSTKVIKSGDPYAVELFEKFNKTEMKHFDLTKAEIDSILDYIDPTQISLPE